jgi:hypothetical protein
MAELVPGLQQAQPPAGPPQAGPQPAGLPQPPSGPPPINPPTQIGEEKKIEDYGISELEAKRAELRQNQANILRTLEERAKPNPSDFWASMARGFGDPNNKSFASGAAGFASNLQASNEAQRGKEMDLYKMRSEMAKKEYEENNQQTIQDITSKLYTKDATGNFVLNPQAAQALTRLTGKPEYVQQLVADQRKRNQGQAFNSMFVQKETPEGNKIDFDKNAFKAYMSASENPLEDAAKFADLYKKIRPLMFGSSDTGSVFDAAIMGAKDHPEIQALALKYKKLEQSGLLDEEKAYKMAMDLTTLLSKKEDSAQSRDDRKLLAMMTQAIHSSRQELLPH